MENPNNEATQPVEGEIVTETPAAATEEPAEVELAQEAATIERDVEFDESAEEGESD